MRALFTLVERLWRRGQRWTEPTVGVKAVTWWESLRRTQGESFLFIQALCPGLLASPSLHLHSHSVLLLEQPLHKSLLRICFQNPTSRHP